MSVAFFKLKEAKSAIKSGCVIEVSKKSFAGAMKQGLENAELMDAVKIDVRDGADGAEFKVVAFFYSRHGGARVDFESKMADESKESKDSKKLKAQVVEGALRDVKGPKLARFNLAVKGARKAVWVPIDSKLEEALRWMVVEEMHTEREPEEAPKAEEPMAPMETEGPKKKMETQVPKPMETQVSSAPVASAPLPSPASHSPLPVPSSSALETKAEKAAEVAREAEAAEAAEALDEAKREEIEGRLWALNEEARKLTDALDALDARKEERKEERKEKKKKRSRRIEEAGEARETGEAEQHQNEEEEEEQREETKTKRRRMFAWDARDYVDSGFYGQGYRGGMGGIPVVDPVALCEWEKKLPGGEMMMMVERPVCDGPREPRLTAVSEDVHGSPELAAELDARLEALETKYGSRVVKDYEAEGLDGLMGRHGLEYRVFAVERHPSVECGCEPETWLETMRVWLPRGSEALRELDELIARERRPASPTRPAPVARTTELTPWEPIAVWEPPRSPRSPAYRPVSPAYAYAQRSPEPVDHDEMSCVD
jgi:chemotaxis protein histidine kinase CheA